MYFIFTTVKCSIYLFNDIIVRINVIYRFIHQTENVVVFFTHGRKHFPPNYFFYLTLRKITAQSYYKKGESYAIIFYRCVQIVLHVRVCTLSDW